MALEQAIGPIAQIPKGEGRAFDVDGRRVAVFHTRDGEVFAIEANCPHRNGPLADGLTGGTTVLCPLHERAFDLRTGAGVGHEDCVMPFPVRLSGDGTLFIILDQPSNAVSV
jgi:nitrite reductase (NADH) small subunit